MRARIYLLLVLALSGLVASAAAQDVAGLQYPDLAHNETYAHVSKVQVNANNYLYIKVAGGLSYGHGCADPWYARSAYPLDDARTRAWMQLATASFLARRSVHVWTQGCTTGKSEYPILVGLQIQERPPVAPGSAGHPSGETGDESLVRETDLEIGNSIK